MSNNDGNFHGSDLEKISDYYNIEINNLLDFSSNINPLGISPLLKNNLSSKINCISSYPDRNYKKLRESIASYTNSDSDHIIVGNGSTELISLLIQIKKPRQALIIGPTYSEYQRELSLYDGVSYYYPLKEINNFELNVAELKEHLTSNIDILILCNPNNPTSTAIKSSTIRIILDHCKQNNIFVMIDETYVEFAEEMDKITAISLTNYYNNLIILRGISKFFASPGLRLGYGITSNDSLIKKLNSRKNPWTINTLASIAGEIMFSDNNYIKETKELINSERARIISILNQWSSIKIFEPTTNFVLFKLLNENLTSKYVFESLVQRNLVVRDCSSFPFFNNNFIRFCIMLPEHNDLLIDALSEILNQ